MALQVPAKTSAQQKIVNTVRKGQQNGSLAERAKAILARPNALTSMGMINPRVVNKEEAGIVSEYRALSSPGFAAQRGPVAPPTPFQARKALTGPQGLLNMAKGMGVGALEAAEIWREEVGLPTVGAASWALSPSVREQYDIARAKGEDPRKAMATAWQKGLTDTPWGAKGLAELIVDPINLVPVLGFPGAIARGAGAGARLGARTAAPVGRGLAEGVAQLPVPGALRPQRAYTMPPEGDPGGIGARRTEEIRKQAEQARQAGQQPSWLTDPMQTEAIRNTAGAEITAEGILLKAVRFQKPEQSGMFSIRSGVFYLPEVKSPYQRYYSTGKVGYGGKQKIERTIEVKNPIILKGASGGKVPERAYDMVMGKKGSYQAMRADVLKATSRLSRSASDDILNAVADVLAKYGGDEGMASEIIRFSKEGNQLPYAVQENIVANVVRNAGYDAILGYNKVRGRNRLSEVFALSETHYPDPMDVMPSPVARQTAEEALEEVPPLRTGKTRPEDTGEGYAINIKLGKYSKETQDIIDSVAARHTEALVNAKRDVRSTADTLADARKLIDEVGGDADKVIRDWKPGQAWNAETITALRLGLQDKARAVEELAYRVWDPNKATNEDIARFRILMGELVSLQHVVTGVTSEVARATQSLSIKIADITDVGGFATSPKALRDLIDQTKGMDDIPAIAREFLSRVEAGDTFQAQKLLNDALKPTWFDYITELWINSLLSSPKTLFINSISNMANTIMSPVERATAAGVESILAPLSGRARERFFAEVPADAYGAYAGLIDGVKAWLKVVRAGINPAEATKYDFSQKAFKGKLGTLIRLPGTFLEAADAGHAAINERAAMEALVIRMVRKEGLKGDERVARMAELKLNPTKGMLREVRDTAQYRLFRNELTGWVGDLQKYRNKHPWIRLIIPFLRTPANLVTYGLVRSPLGVFNKNMWRNIAEKNPEASDEIARVFLGTAVGGGLVAVLKDRITGRPPTNPADRDRFYREGKLPYAIKVGDTWIQYQRLEPFNQVLAQVAAYHQYMDEVEEGEEFDINTMVGNISATIVQNLMSQSYLSGMSDLFMLFTEPDRYTQSYVSRLAAGFIPGSSLLRTIAQMQDRTIRRPRGGTLGIGEGLQAGLPTIDTPVGTFGAGTTQPVVTAMGEDVQRPGSPWFPITYSTEDMSRLDTELNRLNIRVGLASRVLAGENLTPDQYTQYQRLVGRLVQEHLQEAINQPNYQGLPDARKERALERAIADAREKGRDEMVAILEVEASEIAPGVPVTPGASILDRF